MSEMIQSIPLIRFSPVTALHCNICQWCVLIISSCKHYKNMHGSLIGNHKIKHRTSLISSADKAPGKSCLFANTRRVAPANLYNLLTRMVYIILVLHMYVHTSLIYCLPLPTVKHEAHLCSPAIFYDLHCPPPILGHQCFQNNFSNTILETSDHQHPKSLA